jgi:mannose-6-phosphate isomerase-like protein (cupin superfamily)
MRQLVSVLALGGCALWAADQPERIVDPTFLHRSVPAVQAQAADISTDSCQYRPLFGEGDSQRAIVRGVARFGEIAVAAGGNCNPVAYPAEEQVYVIMEGEGMVHYGDETAPVKKHDFLYLPANVRHGISNSSAAPLRLFVMGFRIPPDTAPAPKLTIANIDEIKKQTVGSHPDSVVYQLMMGDTTSQRDRIAAGHVLTSLYMMEFQPGGTNFPHHHDAEEEIYVLIDGTGQMVAGSGLDGVAARFPAKPGDAYFFRLNCTVGFYNGNQGLAHILAVRSVYPRRGNGR